jgi:hypothetical protein
MTETILGRRVPEDLWLNSLSALMKERARQAEQSVTHKPGAP